VTRLERCAQVKRKMYTACIQSITIYGSETWQAVKAAYMMCLERTENMIVVKIDWQLVSYVKGWVSHVCVILSDIAG